MIFLVMAIFNRISALTLVMKGIFVIIWSMVLNWLCSKGFSGLAWIIVLLPFLAIFMTMFTTMDMMSVRGSENFAIDRTHIIFSPGFDPLNRADEPKDEDVEGFSFLGMGDVFGGNQGRKIGGDSPQFNKGLKDAVNTAVKTVRGIKGSGHFTKGK
jgi:hypothetical protein